VAKELEEMELRQCLGRDLPDYMIPSYFVQMERLPLSPTGKIDRKALPEPGKKQEEYIAPRNDVEEKLAEIWSEVLAMEKGAIGIDDNFFRLGGHSIKATLMISGINGELGVTVPLVEAFKTPTIRQLGEYISNAQTGSDRVSDGHLVLLKKGEENAGPFFFIHAGTGEVEVYMEFCDRLGSQYDCWGLQAETLRNYTPGNRSIEEIAREYIKKIETVQPQGPYRIAGWCIGGTIAFEMARQLEEKNQEVELLALIDSLPPDDSLATGMKFNLSTELEAVRNCFPELMDELKGIDVFDRVWPEVLSHAGELHIPEKFLTETTAPLVPDPERLSIEEFVLYLNMVRTLDNARNNYIPIGKVKRGVHFFKASDTVMMKDVIDAGKWNTYSETPARVYDIPGNHFSILKMPLVKEFAQLFAGIINRD
jgi:thioesterase domain-containing protein/acyl carrier protein